MPAGSEATPHSISSLKRAAETFGTVTITLSNGSTSKVLFSVMLPGRDRVADAAAVGERHLGQRAAVRDRGAVGGGEEAVGHEVAEVGLALADRVRVAAVEQASVVPITFAARLAL